MPEKIYTLNNSGALDALKETPFSLEDELQALIAKHPELIGGEQIRPGHARRWILIQREKGISPSAGHRAMWEVDHLIVDQDAVPTLVEVKLGSNPEVRRTIVGQLLEYAAHASETWTADELRTAFERDTDARDCDPRDELAILLKTDGEPDADKFWDDVSRNLAAKRLRLLFIADSIPDPLVRVAEFLNEQMPNIEVMAVEIKRFQGKSDQTLVSRVIGRPTSSATRRHSRPRLTRESFLQGFENEKMKKVAVSLLDVAREEKGEINYGVSGLSIRARCSCRNEPVSVAWLYSNKGSGWMNTHDFSFGDGILDEEDLPDPLRKILETWIDELSSIPSADDALSKRVRAKAIAHESAVEIQDELVEKLRRVIREIVQL